MKTYVIDNGSSGIVQLATLLEEHGLEPIVASYSALSLAKLHKSDVVVLSGSSGITAGWHNNLLAEEIEIILNHTGPIIGICMGMQLIAHAYGSHLHLMDEKVYGTRELELANDVLGTANTKLEVFESHHWCLRSASQPLEVLAQSEDGIEVIRHAERPVYGVQFHPEASQPGDGVALFETILRLTKAIH